MWKWRFDMPSHEARKTELREMLADEDGIAFEALSEYWREELAKAEKGRSWAKLPEDRQASLETAYQRYLRQG